MTLLSRHDDVLNRRAALRSLSLGTIGVLVTACAPSIPPATTSAPVAATPGTTPVTGNSPVAAAGPAGAAPPPLAQRATVRMVLNPQGITNLPTLLAIDKGYFDKANLDLQVEQSNGSSVQQLPRLATGGLDLLPITPAPALYNQLTQGFDVKVIAPAGTEKSGRLTQVWLTLLPEKKNEIKDLSDLRNRTIEGAIAGSGISVLVELAIRQAGLTNGKDVTVTYRAKTLPEIIQLAQSKGADVLGCSEPLATQGAQQGAWVKWKGISDVVPWYQPGLLAASQQSLSGNRRAAVVKWLEVYLYACREVNATNGVWTPELTDTIVKWAQVKAAVITDQGLAPYFDPNGAIILESLDRIQRLWQELGDVKQPIEIQQMVDMSLADEAAQHLGRLTG